jgi:hypothetical protein
LMIILSLVFQDYSFTIRQKENHDRAHLDYF